ncbi:acetoacetate decarboxylase family protein [Zhongshania sp.]|uniref:acetoacetate decarboxylase family protein n=1 Tax=Zhongshania sp. TaxID=1971902 RepID=UPI001B773469|nr:acetoacetate decarboxylase family protein [Zhongshania sp.]MBQ0796696.1 acetoacetate decarboxylase family protein [Zhongshania sp.]|tara:strand:- start:141 stop:983 length:843 start_codon:yes stop_codon:yes gene_type:complete
MQNTAIICQEEPVPSQSGEQITNEHCSKLDEKNYLIAGENIALPVKVGAAAMLMNIFVVDAKKAQALIADSGFKVVEIWPGKALMQLLGVDYQQNDLGDYNEAAIVFPVTTPGESKPLPVVGSIWRMIRGSLNNYVYRMPVNQGFTTHAGRFIWGFPKWVCDVDIQFGQKAASATFKDDGELVFGIKSATGGASVAKPQAAPSLAIRDGMAWKTIGTTEGEGLTFKLGGDKPQIGERHPLALQLRELGLPKKPMCTISMTKTKMQFEGPEAVKIGTPFSS